MIKQLRTALSDNVIVFSLSDYRAMHYIAKRGLAIARRPSSVRL